MKTNKFLFSLLLFCLATLASNGQESPLNVEIQSVHTEVKNLEEFPISASIRNTGSDEQVFWVWSCGYIQWNTDNSSVLLGVEDCLKNPLRKVIIKSGEAGHWVVPVRVYLPAGSAHLVSATFRLGFQPETCRGDQEGPRIWSNAVTVSVTR